MKVIICGAGQVGWQIARHLAGERNDVTVIDTNPELVRRASDLLDVQGVVGFASHPDVLDRAGARDCDLIIAATYSDEVNMVTCQVAQSVFGITRKIARLRAQTYMAPQYADLYRRDHLPIDVIISPEREVADAAIQRLLAPATFDTESFLNGAVQLLGIALEEECPVLDTPLRQLNDLFPTLGAMVVGVRREGRLFAPEAGDQLFAGDQIYVFTLSKDINRTLEIFGKATKKQERITIIGGGIVGLGVAKALEARSDRVRVKIIERDRKTAEEAADALERTIVLHGDGMGTEMMDEANVARADAVLAVTDDDKTNILAAVRAKQFGCKMAISLVNDPTLVPLMAPLDIDAYINPRAITVSSILRHIRHGKVRGVYSIGDAEAEVIEAVVLSTSPIAGRAVREIEFPEGVLLGALRKGDMVMKPTGDTKVEENDVIVLFALSHDIPEVERLLQVSIDFF
ncbi:trk system potassium uptake protein TrkA [Rhodobacter aestuarii]|uniref:Trk system potassium uptake protein TrkA n=1 Tax=Rhodobacter aestuarii TaxID=453582 RepID=A0A1N7JBB3_9RHOB|nr:MULTISPECIES: Trk system potassium transporter TrkA [Rhodobacter]PTV96981.1 trk system potassium uptake protein TrkA [Rhodobacter aestuarii]SIS46551.1 trk system potassium uptake protein TrkA [Rhodobacter aestuarii]SOB98224.1 trk system potassium uptake protein TrkA [Rhodobacter sp. JA431]